MKPNFALNLSHEGIVLLHRSPKGTWVEVGDVALDDPNLRDNLSFLRSTAVGLDGKGFGTRLIIPNSQILYRSIHAPGPTPEDREQQISAALEGELPYPIDELAFDWRREGDAVVVAIVARDTLEEAESFAVEHRFNPISFVARETDETDSWEPFFGRTDYSYAILDEDVDLREPALETTDEATLFDDLDAETEAADDLPDAIDDVEAPQDDAEALNVTNFFVDEDAEPAEGLNLFAQTNTESTDDDAPAPEPETAALEPEADEPLVEATGDVPTPSFASRRSMMTVSGGDSKNRPLNRVAPRIALGEAGGEELPNGPVLSDEERLRAEYLRDESKAPGPFARLKNSIAPLGSKTAKALTTGAKSVTSRAGKLTGSLFGGLTSKLAFDGKSRKATPDDDTPMVVPLETKSGVIAPIDAPETAGAEPTPDEGHEKPSNRQKMIAAGIVALALLFGGVWLFLPGETPINLTGDPAIDAENASFTTLAERGVTRENRARHRPSDFEETVASLNPDLLITIPERPARRTLLAEEDDPDLGLPDTAEDLSDLTEEELADIRRAGAPVPTAEEFAENGEGDESSLFSDEEIAVLYAETGVLQELRIPPKPRLDQDRDDIYVAQPDIELGAQDATILPDFNNGVADDPPRQLMSPVSPDIEFEVDERGFVIATLEGALNPDGVLVRKGRPEVRPPEKPAREELVPPNPLAALKPKPRPEALKTGEAAIFVQGTLTIAALREKRARPRPQSEQFALATEADAQSASELAILTSFQPAKRPSDFSELVEKTRIQLASASPATEEIKRDVNVNTGPALPTRASVAKQATIKNAINLSKINLIGVYGSPSKRSALLRLPSGRYVKVKIGDRIDGGRVAAISTNSLSYVKSGRNRVLKVPN